MTDTVKSHKCVSRWECYSYSGINSFSNIEKTLEAAVDHKLSVRYMCQTAMGKGTCPICTVINGNRAERTCRVLQGPGKVSGGVLCP